jgi:hypothetical protein
LLSSEVLKLRQSRSPFTAQRRAVASGVDPRHARVLQLQRDAGNKAVSQMVAAQRQAAGHARVQRAMSTTAGDLARYRSGSTGTYARIVKVLRDFDKARTPEIKQQLAVLIRGLCNVWLKDHERPKSSRERTQRQKIELLEAESFREMGVLAAQTQYLKGFDANAGPGAGAVQGPRRISGQNQAPAQAGPSRLLPGVAPNGRGYLQAPFDPNKQFGQFEALTMGPRLNAAGPAKALAGGETVKANATAGADKTAQRVASKYKLSAAEIAAIRTYSFADYAYMNTAASNNRARLEVNMRTSKDNYLKKLAAAPGGFDTAMKEGAMHAGVLMQALAKIEPFAKKGYRGERLSASEFYKRYVVGAVVPGTNKEPGKSSTDVVYNRFGSASKKRHVAEGYAQGTAGDLTPLPNETVSVLLELELTNARDIEALSGAPKGEYEVLILPGARFQITAIQQAPEGQRAEGKPPATHWVIVKLKQIA